MAIEHFKRIADASDLPIIAFQYPLATGQGYPNDTLLQMIERGADDPRDQGLGRQRRSSTRWHVRTLQNLPRPVNVLSTQARG